MKEFAPENMPVKKKGKDLNPAMCLLGCLMGMFLGMADSKLRKNHHETQNGVVSYS